MKFFEVEPGHSINVSKIERFKDAGDNFTFIRTESGEELVIFLGYESFKNLIRQSTSIEQNIEHNIAQIAKNQRYATP